MLDRFVDPLVRKMLRPPPRAPRPLPQALAARAEDVTIPATTVPLKAWLIRPDSSPPKATVVLVHGWGGDAGRMAPLARHLLGAGVEALLVDLPGHGRTGDVEHYNAARMVDDVRASRDWIARRDERVVRPVGVVGYSFGGLGAYVAASRDPRWAALVVIAAPAGAMAAARLYLDGRGFPGALLERALRRWFTRELGADPYTFDARANLGRIRVPVLVVHGERDETVPVEHADQIAAAVPSGLATLVRIASGDHNGVLVDDDVGLRIAAFLSRHLTKVTEAG